jgi:hypothetical protein
MLQSDDTKYWHKMTERDNKMWFHNFWLIKEIKQSDDPN